MVVLQINSKTEFIWGTLRDFAYYQNKRPFLFKNFTVTTDGCNKQTTKPGWIKDSGKRNTYSYMKLWMSLKCNSVLRVPLFSLDKLHCDKDSGVRTNKGCFNWITSVTSFATTTFHTFTLTFTPTFVTNLVFTSSRFGPLRLSVEQQVFYKQNEHYTTYDQHSSKHVRDSLDSFCICHTIHALDVNVFYVYQNAINTAYFCCRNFRVLFFHYFLPKTSGDVDLFVLCYLFILFENIFNSNARPE